MGGCLVFLEQKLKHVGFDTFRNLKINWIMKGALSTKPTGFVSHGVYAEYFVRSLFCLVFCCLFVGLFSVRTLSKQCMPFWKGEMGKILNWHCYFLVLGANCRAEPKQLHFVRGIATLCISIKEIFSILPLLPWALQLLCKTFIYSKAKLFYFYA